MCSTVQPSTSVIVGVKLSTGWILIPAVIQVAALLFQVTICMESVIILSINHCATVDVELHCKGRGTVLASDPCTRLLDGHEVKIMGTFFQNYTIKEEMHGQLCKNWKKHGQLSNPS